VIIKHIFFELPVSKKWKKHLIRLLIYKLALIDQTVDMGNPHMFSALHGLIAKKFRHDDPSLSPVEYLMGKECLHF